jgi:hypothetical protein
MMNPNILMGELCTRVMMNPNILMLKICIINSRVQQATDADLKKGGRDARIPYSLFLSHPRIKKSTAEC